MWQLDWDRFVLLGLPAQIRLGSTGLYGVKEARLLWVEDHQQAEWYSTHGFVLWGLEAGDSTKRSGFGCQKTFGEPFWCSMTQFPHLWKGHNTADLCKRLWARQPREFGVTVVAVVLAIDGDRTRALHLSNAFLCPFMHAASMKRWFVLSL